MTAPNTQRPSVHITGQTGATHHGPRPGLPNNNTSHAPGR